MSKDKKRKSAEALLDMGDRVGVRPAAVAMVMGCALFAAGVSYFRSAPVVAAGVTHAPDVVLSLDTPARVAKLHVRTGDRVKTGQPIATLTSRDLELERDLLDAEIKRAVRGAEVSRLELLRNLDAEQRSTLARLEAAERDRDRATLEVEQKAAALRTAQQLVKEGQTLADEGLLGADALRERTLAQEATAAEAAAAEHLRDAELQRVTSLRKAMAQAGAPTALLDALGELHRAELDVLERRRARLDAELVALVVRAPAVGVVTDLLAPGSEVPAGTPVARFMPPFATDVVAYLPADRPPTALAETMAYTVVIADGRECAGKTRPRAFGGVERKPELLAGVTGFDAYGFPIRVSLDEKCRLPVGQTVELRLELP